MLHTLVGIGNAAIAVPQGINKVLKKKKKKERKNGMQYTALERRIKKLLCFPSWAMT